MTVPLASHDHPLGVREAYDALEAFGRSAGRVPLLLLMHAAVPQSFRADLVNLLKQNFLASEAGTDMTVDADVLLSPLVQPAAGNFCRLDPEVRRHCLALLDATYRDRPVRRSVEVAWFLMAYVEALEDQAGLALDPLLAEYLDVQRWVAASFIDPGGAAATFARALAGRVASGETRASALLGSITSAISVPLSGQETLLTYARGLDAVERGDAEAAQRLLEWTRDDALVVGGVSLRPGRELLARLGTTRTGTTASAPPAEVTGTAEAPTSSAAATPGTPPTPPRINVPPPGPPMIGRKRELELARTLLTRPASVDAPRQAARIVRIVGEDGMGKWTLANELVNRTDVPGHFPDGIVWLGEDGSGYPTDALATFASGIGVPDLVDDRRLMRSERLREMLATRRVLLVVEQRSASDIVGMVLGNVGPDCAVLHLVPADRTDNPNRVVLEPLASEEAQILSRRFEGTPPNAGNAFSGYARGNPLLLTLAGTAQQFGLSLTPAEEVWAAIDRFFAALIPAVPPGTREMLRSLADVSPEHRTIFTREELNAVGGTGDDTAVGVLMRLHLATDLGDIVRIHPRVRSGLMRAKFETPSQAAAPPYEANETGYVYLSYADADVETARKLQQALESAGLHTRARIRPDSRTRQQIRDDIGNASAMVIVLSSHLIKDVPAYLINEWDWTAEEVASRRPLSNFVVPVAVDDVSASDLELPGMLETITWGRAPGGIPSAGTLAALRTILRETQLSRGAEPADRPAAALRTDDYALVVGIARYPGLKLEFPELRTAAGLMIEWLSSPDGGGIPGENVNLLMQNETSRGDAPEPSYDHVEKSLASLAESVQPSRRTSSPRRLYLCFYGAVVSGTRGDIGLLTADATPVRSRTVGVLEWRRYFSDGPFAEVVCIVDGVNAQPPSPIVSEVSPLSSRRTRESVSTFTGMGLAASPTSQSAGTLTTVFLEGLRGGATGFEGQITSATLASFIDKKMRATAWSDARGQVPAIEYQGEIVFNDTTPPSAA